MSAPRATTGRFVAGLVGLFVCSTMAWLLVWAAAVSLWHGSAPVLVASGSMGPSVRAGDLVVLEPFHSQELTPGTVIRFDDPSGRGSVLHRIVEIDEDGDLRTKGDANAVVDSSAVEAGRVTGVGSVLVPRAGLPVLWWRHGEWLALALYSLVALTAVFVTRYALLDVHDPWRHPEPEPEPEPGPRPPLPAAAREAIDRFRDEVARDGPVLVSRRLVLRRGAELTAVGLGVAFLASSRTAWAAFADTATNGANTFGAGTLTPPTGLTLVAAGCGGSTGIVQSAQSTTSVASGGSIVTVTAPTGVVAGQLLVAHIGIHTHTFTGTLSPPSGWTTVRVDHDGQHEMQGVFWKIATAAEPGSYVFTATAGDIRGGDEGRGAITAYDGCDSTAPIEAHAGATYAGGTSVTAPSVTTTVAGSRLLVLVTKRNAGGVDPDPAMVERYEASAGSQNTIAMADQPLVASGPTGTRTVTSAGNGSQVVQTVALRPRQIVPTGTGATGSAPNGAAGTLTLSRPAGAAAGDVLVAHVVLHTHAFPANPITPPAGWTTVRVDHDANHIASGVFWKLAGSSEPASYTFANASGDTSEQAVGAITSYRGLDPANPIDAHAATTYPSATGSVVAPSVTTTRPAARLLSLVGAYGNDHGPATPPGSMTERYEGTVVNESAVVQCLGELADEPLVSAGATGTRTTALPGAGSAVVQSAALRPYTAEPYADLTWTPSTSPAVEGYLIERRIGATLDASATVVPGTASSFTDGPLVVGTTYTYRVIAVAGTWRSAPVTTTFTPAAC